MKYSEEFKKAVNFSKVNNLFLGYGNPIGKILMVGKEQYYDSKEIPDSDKFYDDLLEVRKQENQKNINCWIKNVKDNFSPTWNIFMTREEINSNAYTNYWNQRNVQNKKLKNGEWNFGTSNTYLHYQKIYQNVFLNGENESNINFQKEFFITELNDLLAKKDYNFKRLKELKKDFISKRENLFREDFFRSFPVVIIASGHYSRDFSFDIEDVFDVEYIGKPTEIGNSWYNLHHSKDGSKKRLLIHTRQLSTSVSSELTKELSTVIKNFLEDLD